MEVGPVLIRSRILRTLRIRVRAVHGRGRTLHWSIAGVGLKSLSLSGRGFLGKENGFYGVLMTVSGFADDSQTRPPDTNNTRSLTKRSVDQALSNRLTTGLEMRLDTR